MVDKVSKIIPKVPNALLILLQSFILDSVKAGQEGA